MNNQKKRFNFIKSFVSLIIIFLVNICSFAGVVGDSDGPAFVTKKEFEELKYNFERQINDYNDSLDNKIDGVIASYVKGLTLDVRPTVLLPSINSVLGSNLKFLNYVPGNGSSTNTSSINIIKLRNYSTKYIMTAGLNSASIFWWGKNSKSNVGIYPTIDGNAWINSWSPGQGALVTVQFVGSSTKFYSTSMGGSGTTIDAGTFTQLDMSNTSPKMYFKPAEYARLKCISYAYSSSSGSTPREWSANGTQAAANKTYTVNNVVSGTANRNGSGSAWQYRTSPNGWKILEKYWSSWYLSTIYNLNYKTYKDYSGTAKSSVAANDFKDDNSNCTYAPTQSTSYGRYTTGTNYTSYTTNNKVGYMEQNNNLTRSSTDSTNYEVMQWGRLPVTSIYAMVDNPTITKLTTNLSAYSNLTNSSVSIEDVSHTVSDTGFTLYDMKITPESHNLNSFVNSYLSGIAGEATYLGGGTPIMTTAYGDSQSLDLTIRVKLYTSANAATSGTVKAMISRKQFSSGDYANTLDKIIDGNITCDSTGVGVITFNNIFFEGNKTIWLNLYGNDSNRIVELLDFKADISS